MRNLLALIVLASRARAADRSKPSSRTRQPCTRTRSAAAARAMPITFARTASRSPSSRRTTCRCMHRQYGVPDALVGCHTTLVDGYVVEGHVPIGAVLRMLTERPAIKGISLPGMPAGSPGMFGEKTGPFTIYEIGDGRAKVYAVE